MVADATPIGVAAGGQGWSGTERIDSPRAWVRRAGREAGARRLMPPGNVADLGGDHVVQRTTPSSAWARRRGARSPLPPYPGKAGLYPEGEEIDHRALLTRLVGEFPDGWALSTSARALPEVLALCLAGVRVCSWHRHVRHTPSRRPLSAWEPLIVHGGRELPSAVSQTVIDTLAYGGRFRSFPGAMTGM